MASDSDPEGLRAHLPWRHALPVVLAALCVLTGAWTVRKCFAAIEAARTEADREAVMFEAARLEGAAERAAACAAYGEWTAREVRWIEGVGCVERSGAVVAVGQP